MTHFNTIFTQTKCLFVGHIVLKLRSSNHLHSVGFITSKAAQRSLRLWTAVLFRLDFADSACLGSWRKLCLCLDNRVLHSCWVRQQPLRGCDCVIDGGYFDSGLDIQVACCVVTVAGGALDGGSICNGQSRFCRQEFVHSFLLGLLSLLIFYFFPLYCLSKKKFLIFSEEGNSFRQTTGRA